MIKEHEHIIWSAIKNVPRHLRQDCYQAACVGMVKAYERKDVADNFDAYLYQCMKSEILNELALLCQPVKLDKATFLLLCKYNKIVNEGRDVDELNVSEKRIANLKKLADLKKVGLATLGYV